MSTMERILRLMSEKKASDVYLSAHAPALIKINGLCLPINNQLLPPDAPKALLAEVLPASRIEELEQTGELNMAHAIEGLGNFRVSAMRQRGTYAAVIRYITTDIPPLPSLSVPMILADLIMEKRGLLLMVGLVTLIFGNTAVSVPAPIPGYQVGRYQMGGYNLFVIAVAALLMVGMWLVLRYTRVGLIARGAMQGADVVAALGHNPRTIYMLTFTVGAALSGLAGGVMAPLTGLLPSVGGAYIAKAFITVITGGTAVIAGTLSTSALFGTVNQLVSFASTPVIGEIAMLALALILLRLMPQGVTGRLFRNST